MLAFNLLGDGIQDALAGRESVTDNPRPPQPIPTVSVVGDVSPQHGDVADEPKKALVLQDLEVRFPSLKRGDDGGKWGEPSPECG
ncbi:MAG UNVERIFIED_CONTAM: hypothetical protein LVT10_16280 [Anaerolineae bacterium]